MKDKNWVVIKTGHGHLARNAPILLDLFWPSVVVSLTAPVGVGHQLSKPDAPCANRETAENIPSPGMLVAALEWDKKDVILKNKPEKLLKTKGKTT